MRVLYDLTLAARSETGTWVYAQQLLTALRQLAPDVPLTSQQPKRHTSERAWRRALNAVDTTWWTQVELPHHAQRVGADVIHAPAFVGPTVSAARRIISIHDTTYLTHPNNTGWGLYARLFVGLSARRADAIITFAVHTQRDILRHYRIPDDRVVVIPHGVDPRFAPTPRPTAAAALAARYGLTGPFLLYLGAIEPRKNIPCLLRAFARLGSSVPHRLAIVGRRKDGWPAVERALTELQLGDRVALLGHVPFEDLPLLYSAADLFVYPSLYEGFGLPVLEAMACATPVVASNTSSLPEVGGDAVVYFNPTDSEALAEAMGRVLADRLLREGMIWRGQARAALYTWERAAAQTLALYHAVAERGPEH